MKILTIHFKNINSLEGESVIDFQQAPFSETGVFAITGPNGSGKSSILDVITLGLYGETFRFDRPSDYVMTKHTADCFAVVEFSVDGEKYKSSWHVQRAERESARELLPPQMRLVRLSNGDVLADTPQLVCNRITEITGMNFRNFTRSIMLAQGDFSAFLNALDNERMDILEKIISTDIYADYKKEAIDNAENAQQQLNGLKQKLSTIQLMPPEKQEASEHDLIDFKDQLVELKSQKKTLTQQHDCLQTIATLKKQITEQENGLDKLQKQVTESQMILNRIDDSKEVLLFKDDIDAVQDKQQLISQSKSMLADLQNELGYLKNQLINVDVASLDLTNRTFSEQQEKLEDINDKLNQFIHHQQLDTDYRQTLAVQYAEKESAYIAVSSWLEEHKFDEVLLTDLPEIGKLKKLRLDVADLSGKQKSFSRQSKKIITTLKNNTAILAKEQNQQVDLARQIETDEKELVELSQGNTLEYLESLRVEQQERVNGFQSLYNLAQKHENLAGGTGFFSWFKSKEQPDYDVESLTLELEKLNLSMKSEENIRLTLQEAVNYEGLLKKMTPDRVHLVQGKPCALCGALQHPYAKFPPVVSNSKQALIDQKAKIRQVKENIANVTADITQAQKNSERNKTKKAQLAQLRGQWQSLCNRLNTASYDLDIHKLGLMKELIKKENDELSEILSLMVRIRAKKTSIEKNKALIAKGLVTIEQLQVNTQQINADTQGVSKEQLDFEDALARLQEQEKELADKIEIQLTALGEKMPAKGQEDAVFDKINSRRQDYHAYNFRYKSLTEELANIETKQLACQNEITHSVEQIEIFTNLLKKEEVLGLHLGLIEKQKLIAEKEQYLVHLDREVAVLQKNIQDKMVGTHFTNVQEISRFLDFIENQTELERQQAALVQELETKTLELRATQKQLDEAYAASSDTLLDRLEIEGQLKNVTEKITITALEVEYLERLLDEQKQLRLTHCDLLLKLQQKELDVQRYCAEVALITEESGMSFRRRVQGQLADRLLSQTNAILEKISGRYYLRQAHSEQGLALEVEDTYQTNVRRLPKTLSGGESFIVSLALALGLSELANNGRSVDSLFLDEGFGNLDADSLYTVISTLENLHTHGKTVGVISHVDAVQKRFKAQLQVVKKPNGLGELRKAS
jgi:DNA repair protein SbcC/Rad50